MTNLPDGFIPWSDIPDSGLLSPGMYQMRVVTLEDTVSSTNKRMFVLSASVDEPAEHSGMMIFENFVVGTEDDPKAQQSSTWKDQKNVGAKRFKQFKGAAQLPEESDPVKFCHGAQGAVFLAQASIFVEKGGDYEGTQRNRFNFFKVGSRPTGLDRGVGGAKPKPVAAPAAPAPAPPTGAPSAPPPPQAPAAPSAPAAGMLPCGNCKKEFPIAEFAAHVQACLAGAV